MSSASLPRIREPSAGLYGKIPSQRDFVRINAGDFQHAGLDQWFQQGMECLHAEHLVLPEEATRFLLVSQGGEIFIGSFMPGEDAVGRHFPLVISVRLEARKLVSALPILPWIFDPFLDAATAVAQEARGLTAQDLTAQVDWLKQTLEQSSTVAPLDALLAASGFHELRGAIGNWNEGGAYALHTVLTACEQSSSKPAETFKQTVTVECPTPTEGMRAFWLELVRRKLQAKLQAVAPTPSLMWTQARLLVALGPPPPQLLAYLANPEHKAQRFWPLHTNNVSANEKAVQALCPDLVHLLSSGEASLAGILEACK
jgi:type VI secretion system protein ImpM